MTCSETDLEIGLIGSGAPIPLPAFSARDCTQTLKILPTSILHRTVNGKLVSLCTPQHQKYTSTISCQDKTPPAFDGLWIGSALWINCIQYFVCPIAPNTTSVTLTRPPVDGSAILEDKDGQTHPIQIQNQIVTFTPLPQGGFVHYRPRLQMRLTDYRLKTDEWGCISGWEISLEEI